MAEKIKRDITIDSESASQIYREELLRKTKEELIDIILKQNDIQIPISIFLNKAGPLESLVKYLKDEKKLSIKSISDRLNRNVQTIWTTFRNIKNKKLLFEDKGEKVPLHIFSKNENSILESLVFYLKETSKLRFCEISKILKRDTRTVWIYYHRYTAKKNRNFPGGIKNE